MNEIENKNLISKKLLYLLIEPTIRNFSTRIGTSFEAVGNLQTIVYIL